MLDINCNWPLIAVIVTTDLLMIHVAGLASSPEFTSEQAGRAETEFLLQWRTKSFTPVTQFRLEVAERGSSTWR